MMVNTKGTVVERTKHFASLLAEKYNLHMIHQQCLNEWNLCGEKGESFFIKRTMSNFYTIGWANPSLSSAIRKIVLLHLKWDIQEKSLVIPSIWNWKIAFWTRIIEQLQTAAMDQNVSNKDLLQKLIKRSESKWKEVDHKRIKINSL